MPTKAAPSTHHLDRRAANIAAQDGDDDDLLTTRELANWFSVSEQWVQIGRVKKYGPPYEKLGPKVIRYRRGRVRQWLNTRTCRSTADYRPKQSA